MNAQAKNAFTLIEDQRKHVLTAVTKLSEEQIHYRARPNKWSIAQILTHLITSEQLSQAYMKKKSLAVQDLNNSGIKEALVFNVLQISQRIPTLKFKAPQVVINNTPEPLSLLEIIKQWDQSRNNLYSLLEKIEDKNIKKLIYKHPIAGRLNVLQAMLFYREHIIHHWPQIKRLLNQYS